MWTTEDGTCDRPPTSEAVTTSSLVDPLSPGDVSSARSSICGAVSATAITMRNTCRRRDRISGHLAGRPGTTSDIFAACAKKPLHTLVLAFLRLAQGGTEMANKKVRQTSLTAVEQDIVCFNQDRPAVPLG